MFKKILLISVLSIFNSSLLGIFNNESSKSTIDVTATNGSIRLFTPITGFDGKVDLRLTSGALTQSSSANTLSFSGGAVSFADAGSFSFAQTAKSNGTFDPGTSKLILDTGRLLDLTGTGTMTLTVQIGTGTGTPTARIIGDGYFSRPIDVQAGATLELGIKDKLFADIQLAATANLKLVSDLRLGHNVQIRPTVAGTACQVNLNNFELTFSGTQQITTGFLNFSTSPGFIALASNLKPSNAWQFATAGDFYLRGNGNVLDFSKINGACFRATAANVNLFLDSVHIILPPDAVFSDALGNFNIKLLNNVTFELSGNALLNAGSSSVVQVLGEQNRFLVKNFKFEVNNGWTLNIAANKILDYDIEQTLSYGQIFSSGSGSITYGSGALLRQNRSLTSASNPEMLPTIITSSTTLGRDYFLSSTSAIYFYNSNFASSKAMTLDGGGNSIIFNGGTTKNFQLDPNVQLTLQNITLKNFNPNTVGIGSTSSTISFGDNVTIELNSDITIPTSGSFAWSFVGNAEINGNGHSIIIAADNQLTLGGTNKNLTFSNTILKPQTAFAFKNLTSSNTIILKNSSLLIIYPLFLFNTGNLEIQGDCHFFTTSFFAAQTFAQSKNAALAYGFNIAQASGYLPPYVTYSNSGTTLNRNMYDYEHVQLVEGAQSTMLGLGGGQKLIRYDGSFGGTSAIYSSNLDMSGDTSIGFLRLLSPGFFNVGTDIYAVSGDWSGVTLHLNVGNTKWNLGAAVEILAGTSANRKVYFIASNQYVVPNSFGPVRLATAVSTATTVTEASDCRLTNLNTSPYVIPICASQDQTLWWITTSGAIKKMAQGPGNPVEIFDDGVGKSWRFLQSFGVSATSYFLLAIDNIDSGLYYSRDGSRLTFTGIKNVRRAFVNVNGKIVIIFNDGGIYYNLNILNPEIESFFDFTSAGTFKIKPGATLTIDENTAIRYNPATTNDGGLTYNTKRHLILEDNSATIKLNNGSLISTATGMALDYGRLIISGDCKVYSNSTTGAQVEIGSALELDIDSFSNLNFKGPVEYTKTTAP